MFFFVFKHKTAYEMRISDWSSDVCSSDLPSKPPGIASVFTQCPNRNPMEDADLKALTTKLEQLIQRIEQLKAQNHLLLANERNWREERAHLIEKNERSE